MSPSPGAHTHTEPCSGDRVAAQPGNSHRETTARCPEIHPKEHPTSLAQSRAQKAGGCPQHHLVSPDTPLPPTFAAPEVSLASAWNHPAPPPCASSFPCFFMDFAAPAGETQQREGAVFPRSPRTFNSRRGSCCLHLFLPLSGAQQLALRAFWLSHTCARTGSQGWELQPGGFLFCAPRTLRGQQSFDLGYTEVQLRVHRAFNRKPSLFPWLRGFQRVFSK